MTVQHRGRRTAGLPRKRRNGANAEERSHVSLKVSATHCCHAQEETCEVADWFAKKVIFLGD
jgi:hypothetical protein